MRTRRLIPIVAIAGLSLGPLVGCSSPSGPGGPGGLFPALSFDEMDESGDATIDAKEFQKLADAMFRRLDTDGDGRLSEAEYQRLSERPRRRHAPGGPRPEGGDGGWPGGGGGGPY